MQNMDKTLIDLFKRNKKVTLKKLSHIIGSKEEGALCDVLFNCIYYGVDHLEEEKELLYLEQPLYLLGQIILIYPELSRKDILRKIKKIENKLNDVKLNKNLYDEKIAKEMVEFEEKVDYLTTVSLEKENNWYEFLWYLITETKNKEYIIETLDKLSPSVNMNSKNGKTLFHNIVDCYLEKSNSPKENAEELLYYENILILLKNQDDFTLERKESREILKKVLQSISEISPKDKECYARVMTLEKLKEIVTSSTNTKDTLKQLGNVYKVSIDFPKEIEDRVKLCPKDIDFRNYSDRQLIGDYSISIDESLTNLIDDTISCKRLRNGNFLLGLHSASVLGYAPYESPLIQNAIARGRNIYLSKKVGKHGVKKNRLIPIFPSEFGVEVASLTPDKFRLARSYFY